MAIKIEGRRSVANSHEDMEYRKFAVDEIAELIKKGGHGMLSTWEYTIDGCKYSASGLSIGDETIPFERDGKIIVPTYFRRYMLSGKFREGDPNELVKVEVEVTPDEDTFVTIVGA